MGEFWCAAFVRFIWIAFALNDLGWKITQQHIHTRTHRIINNNKRERKKTRPLCVKMLVCTSTSKGGKKATHNDRIIKAMCVHHDATLIQENRNREEKTRTWSKRYLQFKIQCNPIQFLVYFVDPYMFNFIIVVCIYRQFTFFLALVLFIFFLS